MNAPHPFTGAVIRRGRMVHDRYTQISNSLARDKRLDFKSAGVYLEIASHREGWEITAESLIRDGRGNGREAVMAALQELELYGYLQRFRERRPDGTLGRMVYEISDDPIPVDEFEHDAPKQPSELQTRRSEPKSGEPTQVQPTRVHPDPKKTKGKKTNQKNPNGSPSPLDTPHTPPFRSPSVAPAQIPRQASAPALEALGAPGTTATATADLDPSHGQRERVQQLLERGMRAPAPPRRPAPRQASAGEQLLRHLAARHRSEAAAGQRRRIVLRGKPLTEQAGHLDALLAAGLSMETAQHEIGGLLPDHLTTSYAALIAHRVRELVLLHQPPGSPDAIIGEGRRPGPTKSTATMQGGFCRECKNTRLVHLRDPDSGEERHGQCPACQRPALF